MKTMNNIKTKTFRAAIIASFILIGISANAQNFWKGSIQSNQFEDLAYAGNTVETKTTFSDKEFILTPFVKYIEYIIEEKLELEEWMTNDTYFAVTMLYMEEVIESPLEIENWMINENHFNQRCMFSKMIYTTEEEEKLEMESWMLDNQLWKL